MDQRKCIKFCINIKLNVQGHLKCWLWHLVSLLWAEHKFNCGITAEKMSMTSTTYETIETMKKMILDNRGIIIREIADDVGISFGSCQAIFTDIWHMKRAAAKIIPKLLNLEQKQRRIDIAPELLTTFKDDPDQMIKRVITGDWWITGVWLWHWNPSPIILKEAARRVKTGNRTSRAVKCEGFAHCFLWLQCCGAYEFLSLGRTFNKEYYFEVVHRLREAINQKCTELRKNQPWSMIRE